MTKSRLESIERSRKSRLEKRKEFNSLSETAKNKLDIEILKERIYNIEHDIKNYGELPIFIHKLEILKNNLKKLESKNDN